MDGIQDLVTSFVKSAVRHSLTVAAGALVTHHILNQAAVPSFIDVETGLLMGAFAVGWSLVEKYLQHVGDDGDVQ